MEPQKAQGQCLGGKVELSFDFQNDWFDACHCGMCRKWGLFHMQIFIDRKPANYSFANETQTMTEAEMMAFYGN